MSMLRIGEHPEAVAHYATGPHYDCLCRVCRLQREVIGLKAVLNTPEIEDFDKAVPLEAAHQVIRWGVEHDGGKNPEDWFWLLGFLAGKALASAKAGDLEKAKHHCISSAAVLRNWHAHIRTGKSKMRPGIEVPQGEKTNER